MNTLKTTMLMALLMALMVALGGAFAGLIILGGGVSARLYKFAPMLTLRAPVVAASFLNSAGIVGAALMAETNLLSGADA